MNKEIQTREEEKMIKTLSFALTLTTTSFPSLACRLKWAISGLRPVSICLYIWWHVSISCTARSMWSPGSPLWTPRARVPGRKHTRWSCRAAEIKTRQVMNGSDNGGTAVRRLIGLTRSSLSGELNVTSCSTSDWELKRLKNQLVFLTRSLKIWPRRSELFSFHYHSWLKCPWAKQLTSHTCSSHAANSYGFYEGVKDFLRTELRQF